MRARVDGVPGLNVIHAMGLIINAHERKVLVGELAGKGDNVARILAAISAEPIDLRDREFEKF